jgi:hypothetical protein
MIAELAFLIGGGVVPWGPASLMDYVSSELILTKEG